MLDKMKDIKFIIADDDIDMIRLHRDVIRKRFQENKIYEFLNGFEAISFLEAKSLGDGWQADEWVVITDFYMPIKNGGDVLKYVDKKRIEKIVLVSSANKESILAKMEQEQDFKYLGNIIKKGDHADTLLDWIDSIVQV